MQIYKKPIFPSFWKSEITFICNFIKTKEMKRILLTTLLSIIIADCFSQSNYIINIKSTLTNIDKSLEKFESKCFSDTFYINTKQFDLDLSVIDNQIGIFSNEIKREVLRTLSSPYILLGMTCEIADFRLRLLDKLKNKDTIYKESYLKCKEAYEILYKKCLTIE